jgi:hypothetical protein
MQRPPEGGVGSLRGRDVVEVNPWGEFRLPRSCEGIGVYLMPGSDEVTSKLHLLPRQAAGEVEMGIDECDSQRQPWAGGSLTLLRLGHKISQVDGKWESIAAIQ